MRIFKTKWLARFARQEEIGDGSLSDAIRRAESGLIDADLGGGLIKQRVARQGQGRSGGYRMIIAFRARGRAVFLYAFSKNERDNIDADELAELRKIGMDWLNATTGKILNALDDGAIQEIENDKADSQEPIE